MCSNENTRTIIASAALVGWGGNLAAKRAVWGGTLTVSLSDENDMWFDLGYQNQKGRAGESPSATVMQGGLGFNL